MERPSNREATRAKKLEFVGIEQQKFDVARDDVQPKEPDKDVERPCLYQSKKSEKPTRSEYWTI